MIHKSNSISFFFSNSIQSCKGLPPSDTDFKAVKISETEFVLIFDLDQVAIYNVTSKFWTHIGYLSHPRVHSKAAFFNGKVIVTGGRLWGNSQDFSSTEIIDINRRQMRPGGNLNFGRTLHGMAKVTINEELKLIAFGYTCSLYKQPGKLEDRIIEVWNDDKEIWEVNENDRNRVIGIKRSFSTLTIPSYNI